MKQQLKTVEIKVLGTLIGLLLGLGSIDVHASEGEDYITISVEATDDNGQMMYALDSDEPEAFTASNEFSVPAGSSHTIYVKDSAGNIASQVYEPEENASTAISVEEFTVTEGNGRDQQINIELEIGEEESSIDWYEDYDYLTDTPVEPGLGTVQSKVTTDGSQDASKVFYTITTKEGKVFYMIIDQNQSADNVYLLDQVTLSDLEALASQESGKEEQEAEKSLLEAMAEQDVKVQSSEENGNAKVGTSTSKANLIIVIIIVLVGGGYYYYVRVYKVKKEQVMDAMDAMDMDDFTAEEDVDDEEIEFDTDEEEKQKFLQELMDEEEVAGSEEEFLNIDPEEYYQVDETDGGYEEENFYDDEPMEIEVDEEGEDE